MQSCTTPRRIRRQTSPTTTPRTLSISRNTSKSNARRLNARRNFRAFLSTRHSLPMSMSNRIPLRPTHHQPTLKELRIRTSRTQQAPFIHMTTRLNLRSRFKSLRFHRIQKSPVFLPPSNATHRKGTRTQRRIVKTTMPGVLATGDSRYQALPVRG